MRLLLLATLSVSAIYGSDKITVFESDHFELITDGPHGRAQDILGQFERVRSFFNRVLPLSQPLMKPRVIVFNSEKDFRALAPNEVAAAYYTPMPHRDVIAIGAAGRGYDQRSVVHEYLHMLARYTDSDLPLWMDEGIAELYSTIQPLGKKIQVGAPIANHLVLLQNDWLGLENVVGVTHSSPIYNRRAHAGSFYASSWALAHMLQLGTNYKAGYGKFAAAINSGTRTDDALLAVYGKTLKQVDDDLRAYVRGNTVNTLIFDIQFDRSDRIEPRPVTAYEWDLARAYLMTATRKYEEGSALFDSLVAVEPTRSDAWEGLAFLHWVSRGKGSRDRAAEAFAKALELKSTNPNLAVYSRGITSDTKLSGAALQSLTERYPDYAEGRIRLAEHFLYVGEFLQSYDEIKKVKKITPRQASQYFPVLIQTSWRLKRLEECRAAAVQFKQVAKTEADQTLANTWFTYAMQEHPPERPILARMESADPNPIKPPLLGQPLDFPLEEAGIEIVKQGDTVRMVTSRLTFLEGTLVDLECKDPQAILNIKTGAGVTRLLIEDPANINLKGEGQAAKIELTCGPQSSRIKAGYFPRENPAEKTTGTLASLEFMK